MEKQFLIVEPNPIVALDLAEAISETFVGATVSLATSIEDARAELSVMSGVLATLVGLPSADVLASDLPGDVEDQGGHLVFLNDAGGLARRAGARFVVSRPFSSEMISDILVRIAVDPQPSRPASHRETPA